MLPSVRKLFKQAKNDKVFNAQMAKADSQWETPSIFWDNNVRVVYAAVYEGWLVGRGEFDESNYR